MSTKEIIPTAAVPPVVPVEVPAPAEPKRKYDGPAYVCPLEDITPSTHPEAQAQYAKGKFYKADRFLRKLWMSAKGRDLLEAYTGSPADRPADEDLDDE